MKRNGSGSAGITALFSVIFPDLAEFRIRIAFLKPMA